MKIDRDSFIKTCEDLKDEYIASHCHHKYLKVNASGIASVGDKDSTGASIVSIRKIIETVDQLMKDKDDPLNEDECKSINSFLSTLEEAVIMKRKFSKHAWIGEIFYKLFPFCKKPERKLTETRSKLEKIRFQAEKEKLDLEKLIALNESIKKYNEAIIKVNIGCIEALNKEIEEENKLRSGRWSTRNLKEIAPIPLELAKDTDKLSLVVQQVLLEVKADYDAMQASLEALMTSWNRIEATWREQLKNINESIDSQLDK